MTSVKAYFHTTIAAMAIAVGTFLSAPANATVSTPFGGFSGPGFGLIFPPPLGFGVGNGGPGSGGYYTGFSICHPPYCPPQLGIGNMGGVPSPGMTNRQELSVSTPFGGFSGPGFGIGFGPFGASFGGFGLGGPGYPPGVTPFFGLNEQQALSVRTPWGGVSMPGFGVFPPIGGGWGIGFGPFGANFGGFGLPSPYPPLPANFGISTPWGGMNMGGFGVGGQSPVMPINMPYPY